MSEGDLVSRVEAWLRAQEWQLNEGIVADHGQYLLTPGDGPAPWPLLAVVEDDDARVLFYSVFPDDVPEPQRPAIAALLTHVNYGLLNGVAELDMTDGELRVRTGVELGAATVDDDALAAMLSRALGSNLQLAEAVWNATDDVLDNGADPATAASSLDDVS